MDRQILTQEEINALLKGEEAESSQLSPMQKDALGEIGNISYGTASTALSELLNKRVIIDTPTVVLTTQKELKEQHPLPYVLVEVDYKTGLVGSNVLILKVSDAVIIADLMMGKDGSNPKQNLDQIELSAVGESMNQMVGNAATSLSTLFGQRIDVDPPRIKIVDLSSDESIVRDLELDSQVVVVSFKLQIDGLVDSELMLVVPYDLAVDLADRLIAETQVAANSVAVSAAPASEPMMPIPEMSAKVPEPPAVQPLPPSQPMVEPVYSEPAIAAVSTPAPINSNYRTEVKTPVMVQPAQFGPISNGKTSKETGNIGLILDVPLQVTVELGGTRMKIKDILDLGIGSIIELDKLAGDPVDVYVNGKMIAKGEVVVIDENFGIKITDIISPIERANTLQ